MGKKVDRVRGETTSEGRYRGRERVRVEERGVGEGRDRVKGESRDKRKWEER